MEELFNIILIFSRFVKGILVQGQKIARSCREASGLYRPMGTVAADSFSSWTDQQSLIN